MATTPKTSNNDTQTTRTQQVDGPDSDEASPRFSSVCAYCWWWKPSDRHSCAAYPRANSIPDAIWNGQNKHLNRYAGDHGIVFVLHPDANKTPPDWARNAPRVGSPEEQAMAEIAKRLKKPSGTA